MDSPYLNQPAFTVLEAAAVIHGIIPTTKSDIIRLSTTIEVLKKAIRFGELPADPPTEMYWPHLYPYDTDIYCPNDPLWNFSIINRTDLLAWCESRKIRPPLLFPNQTQPDQENPNAPVALSPNFKATLREAGKQSANLQHAEKNQLYHKAIAFAKQQWEGGDKRLHSEMTAFILGMPEYAALSKTALLGRLRKLAISLDKPYLVKGIKKSPR